MVGKLVKQEKCQQGSSIPDQRVKIAVIEGGRIASSCYLVEARMAPGARGWSRGASICVFYTGR